VPTIGWTLAKTYVLFGSTAGFAASFDLSQLDGSSGFRIGGLDSLTPSGRSVAGAGDVNGDGLDDLIIGAPLADSFISGVSSESYVVFGFRPDGAGASSAALDVGLDEEEHFRFAGMGDREAASLGTSNTASKPVISFETESANPTSGQHEDFVIRHSGTMRIIDAPADEMGQAGDEFPFLGTSEDRFSPTVWHDDFLA
jgi:hypothetical protein